MKKKHTFELKAPEAREVLLAGDFTRWQESPIAMKQMKNGDWQASVKLDAGTYSYRFIVDNQWADDPACAMRVPNPYGGQDAVVEVA